MIDEAVAAHYEAVLGQPTRKASFTIAGLPVRVQKWDTSANPFGVAFYGSIGASSEPLPGMPASHRVEFFIGLLPEEDGVARPLAMVATDSATHGSALGNGQTVTYPEPLWAGTEMRSFLVLRPQVEMVPDLVLPDGEHVEFLQLVPIFADELELKASEGSDKLMATFEAAGVRFWDPRRGPLQFR